MRYVDMRYKKNKSVKENDIERVIYDFNNTERTYNKDITIHELFEKQVEKSQDKIAAIYKNQSITYKELNKKANQLARRLRKYGVKQNDIVGLMVHRSIDMLIGIMGILKSGGCYLPIDPSYPIARINYMLNDSGTSIVLTNILHNEEIDFNGLIIFFDSEELYTEDCLYIGNINESSDLAYVIYTSGSTGKPKGVMLDHKAIHNFILGMTEKICFSHKKSIACLTTISFDIFVLESILPLLLGMKIIVADPMQLSTYINNETIDMIQTTPSTMQLILNDKSNYRYIKNLSEIMLGGEAFPKKLLKKLKECTTARIYNMYGPTETTVWSTIKELTYTEEITIGKPIANTQIYIVNDDNNPLGIDQAGELCIAGDGLARGYLKKEELTRERFVENPVVRGRKMYKTGDLAKWLRNGEIEFLGRIDNQVKIRGFRIELEEIEDCLSMHEKIKECVVAVKENESGEKYLVAYYIAERELPVSQIISFLKKSLPDFMIPGFYMLIEKIPLTPNQKIDKNALPKPDADRPNLDTDYVAPETIIENQIAEIWRKVLNRELIGTNDNFFELGGDSLLVSCMYSELEKYLPGRISIVDIFSYPSISKLSSYIEHNKKVELDNAIRALMFPNEFYINNNSYLNELVLKTGIGSSVSKKLRKLASSGNISVYSILLSVYMNLLSEITGSAEIQILSVMGDTPYYKLINIDLSEVSELFELCKVIDEQTADNSLTLKYYRSDINRFIIEKDHFIPTFHFEHKRALNRDKDNEIALEIESHDSGYQASILIYSGSLRKNKLEELIFNYIELLKAVSEKIYLEDSNE
jgi:amino acid adenylation domain-containing protein